ncbi:MAG: hypothetical protein H6Q02_1119 [Acidobacteria bacterium]|nr:hypothetical protein [Acidobacteriota bacterium]
MVLALAGCAPPAVRVATVPTAAPSPGPPHAAAKRAVLERVNAARRDAGLAPVAWDGVLERTGDTFCARLVDELSSGHVLADDVPPYLRYVLAGGDGYHSQNVGSFDSSAAIDPAGADAIAVTLLDRMLAERPPDDGHRRTILDPLATHLGVGVALDEGSVRVSHEFAVRRLVDWRPPPAASRPQSVVTLAGAVVPPLEVAAIEVLWLPLPAGRPAGATPVRSYGYPPGRAMYSASAQRSVRPGEARPDTLETDASGRFTFSWRTGPHEGVELLVVWAGRRRAGSRLEPVGLGATVVTADGSLPPALAAWAALR